MQVNGVGVTANYSLTAINHDRYDDPLGAPAGTFQGSYGSDPDGRNETALAATDFTRASYVNETRLTMWSGDSDWHTWRTQATGQMSIGAVYTPANGRLGFRVYADANANNCLTGDAAKDWFWEGLGDTSDQNGGESEG